LTADVNLTQLMFPFHKGKSIKKTEIIKEHFKLLFAAASFFVHLFIYAKGAK